MAGTLFGVPLSQQIGPDGRIASGALVYVYEANTSTPASTYSDFSLSTEQTWPLECDSAGRVPSFYVDDGSYRLRITTSAGIELVDEQSITSIGASGTETGGSVAQDTSTIFQTGDMLWLPINGTRSGWVRANGRTIGSGSSGASERANSDCQALFEYLWTNFSDTFCAVSSGRGGSATADFNANKTIATLDMRSKGILGMDTMGNSAAGVSGGSSTAADAKGASTNSITVAQANLPNVNLSATALSVNRSTVRVFTGTTWTGVQLSGAVDGMQGTGLSSVSSLVDSTLSGTVPLGGSGTAIGFNILSPVRVGSFYFKL